MTWQSFVITTLLALYVAGGIVLLLQHKSHPDRWLLLEYQILKVGAYLLSLLRSTIGGSGLDFRVRNENG